MTTALTINDHDALLLVDVQNDFCPGGALAVTDGDAVIAPLNRLGARFALVAATRDLHPPDHCSFVTRGGPWPVHCVAGSPGAAYHGELDISRVTLHVSKAAEPEVEAYDGFAGTPDLAAELRARGIERVFVGGLATDYCVLHTVLSARRAGFAAVVVTDAVRAVEARPGDGARALAEMAAAGAVLATSAEIVGE
jgi:nicotinamidase/pyrazinamidase